LLDEPTRGLDYADKERLRELLCRWRSQHKVIVLVSHDVELVAFIANRVVVLENGKIAGDGERQKILKEFPTFTPQLARLFPDQNLLTLKDLGYRQANSPKVREKTEDAPLI
jgi:energy-coupling factor transporter ATP-binding protein EcfA2